MIDPVFEPKSQAGTWKTFYRGRCEGPMLTQEFQLPAGPQRSKLNDQEKIWEQR